MNVRADVFDAALLETLKEIDKGLPRRQFGYGITATEYRLQTGDRFRTNEQAKASLDRLVKSGNLKTEQMVWEGKIVSVYTKK